MRSCLLLPQSKHPTQGSGGASDSSKEIGRPQPSKRRFSLRRLSTSASMSLSLPQMGTLKRMLQAVDTTDVGLQLLGLSDCNNSCGPSRLQITNLSKPVLRTDNDTSQEPSARACSSYPTHCSPPLTTTCRASSQAKSTFAMPACDMMVVTARTKVGVGSPPRARLCSTASTRPLEKSFLRSSSSIFSPQGRSVRSVFNENVRPSMTKVLRGASNTNCLLMWQAMPYKGASDGVAACSADCFRISWSTKCCTAMIWCNSASLKR
mmetsp:Transcript_47351/g.107498  ORF Transcript_47351/g.107498 Transcript_47351/m.107498 type:complete len:264 (+) Transcript_47351:223-1014(+)